MRIQCFGAMLTESRGSTGEEEVGAFMITNAIFGFPTMTEV